MANDPSASYPYPSPTTQLEHLAGAAQQASSPPADFASQQRPPNPRKRRADGTPASARGVANLTPEQLARKRANDREAQRAIRERTRNTIEHLEARIKELEGQQPFQEMQSALRTRDAILAENEELKRRLQNIIVLAQYQSGGHGLNDLALATAQQAPLPMPQTPQHADAHGHESQHQQFPHAYSDREASTPPVAQQNLHPDLRNLQAGQVPTAHMSGLPNGANTSPRQTRRQKPVADLPEWQRMPTHTAPSNPIDTALQGLITARRAALQSGEAPQTVLGPPLPDFTALMSSHRPHNQHPLVSGISLLVSEQMSTSDLPNRVAMMYTTYFLLQWIISPTQEMFDRLPTWLRPTRLQLERQHSMWIDMLPWPQLRDKAMSNPQSYPFNFFYNFTSQLSLNFPYEASLCLLQKSQSGSASSIDGDNADEHWVINPIFEAHIRELHNWTMSEGGDGELEGLLQGLGSASSAKADT
ncbi:hypothetical protein CAC42_2871 [Sphaceloma murrayae]|uniref:BZIP transcription factor n=1 Tax=Sphaceloma murrayae TaxID=2082308 RepID=A0A2K1R128_9PEZI|nr:hypothetical protein CAC42_2871 [Sphaceloma murrayae]